MNKTDTAQTVWKVLTILADELDRDAPLLQSLALAKIASHGEMGMDQGRLMDDLKTSSASASRTVQTLGTTHYLKDREGYGLVERQFDPVDNRKRTLRLTPKGERVMAKLQAVLEGKK